MNTIYHFGDSYATTGMYDTHFVNLISERLNYDYKCGGIIPGGSNEIILNRLLYNMMDIKENDILFVNFSFFVRGSYYDRQENQIKSTNSYYNEFLSTFSFEPTKDYIMGIINYQLDHNEDYNRRLFHQFNTIFERLHHMGVQIYYIYITENEWSDSLLDYGTKIKFPTDFSSWLDANGYHNQEECHYTRGVQGHICDYVMKQIIKDCPKIIPKLI